MRRIFAAIRVPLPVGFGVTTEGVSKLIRVRLETGQEPDRNERRLFGQRVDAAVEEALSVIEGLTGSSARGRRADLEFREWSRQPERN